MNTLSSALDHVWPSLRMGELVPILRNYEWPVTPAYAVYPPTRHLSYRVRAFIDFIGEHFAGVPHWDEECEAPTAKQS